MKYSVEDILNTKYIIKHKVYFRGKGIDFLKLTAKKNTSIVKHNSSNINLISGGYIILIKKIKKGDRFNIKAYDINELNKCCSCMCICKKIVRAKSDLLIFEIGGIHNNSIVDGFIEVEYD